jgi:hypothetical protein
MTCECVMNGKTVLKVETAKSVVKYKEPNGNGDGGFRTRSGVCVHVHTGKEYETHMMENHSSKAKLTSNDWALLKPDGTLSFTNEYYVVEDGFGQRGINDYINHLLGPHLKYLVGLSNGVDVIVLRPVGFGVTDVSLKSEMQLLIERFRQNFVSYCKSYLKRVKYSCTVLMEDV